MRIQHQKQLNELIELIKGHEISHCRSVSWNIYWKSTMIFKWKLKLDSSVFLEKVRGLKSQPCNQLETIAIIYIYSDEIQKRPITG